MIHRAISWAVVVAGVSVGGWAATCSAEFIHFEPAVAAVLPSASTATVVRLGQSVTPLFGYSLDIEIVPLAGATGSVTVDTALTNFFDPENLITAGGAMRDPLFSVVQGTPDGAFISTNTFDLSTLTAMPGVNDALAQIVLVASDDALGDFEVRLGPGTALSDAQGFAVPFTFEAGVVTVVPCPASALLAILIGARGGQRRPTRSPG